MKKQINYQAIFYMGICLVGTGVVFLTTLNPAIGAALILIGGMNILIGALKIRRENTNLEICLKKFLEGNVLRNEEFGYNYLSSGWNVNRTWEHLLKQNPISVYNLTLKKC